VAREPVEARQTAILEAGRMERLVEGARLKDLLPQRGLA